jgi:hypothetical protein
MLKAYDTSASGWPELKQTHISFQTVSMEQNILFQTRIYTNIPRGLRPYTEIGNSYATN